jgi:ferredoxin
MTKRKIIKIDENKCNGCGLCIPNCPEGALQIIDGKARLVSDLFCDGLGACIGYCPQGAVTIEEREAEPYDERKVMENIVRQGKNVIKAHLEHLKSHNAHEYFKQAVDYLKDKGIAVPQLEEEFTHRCPGSQTLDLRKKEQDSRQEKNSFGGLSQLQNWPIQIKLIAVNAPYLNDADLLIAADCVSFAYADFHQDLLKGKILLIGCPKLDDATFYQEKLTRILKHNAIKSITCAHMEVPCCFGLVQVVKSAISLSGKDIPFCELTISIKGERLK